MNKQKPKRYISDIPQLMSEWNWEKNNALGLDPQKLTCGSGRKVWWKCSKGHEWEAIVFSRVRGNKCPYCANQKVLIGYNDLTTTYPEIAKQWHPTKNGHLMPSDVTSGSNKKIWWRCEYGHEWSTMISHRTKGGGCPHCSYNKTSFAELTLLYFIQRYSDVPVVHRYNNLGCEIDIFIPSLKVGIEYDGYIFHKDRIQRDLQKNSLLYEHGVKLYRIREKPLLLLHSTSVDINYRYGSQKEFQEVIEKLILIIFNKRVAIDIDEHRCNIIKLERLTTLNNSIAYTHPTIAKEWYYEKNYPLKPYHVTHGSGKKVWWKCSKCGYEWQSRICERTSGKSQDGCVHCNCTIRNQRRSATIIQNRGSLLDLYPHVAAQWHPTKNGNLKPSDVTASSHTKVWWLCDCGTEWCTTVGDATKKYQRLSIFECPTCAIRRGIKNRNKTQ